MTHTRNIIQERRSIVLSKVRVVQHLYLKLASNNHPGLSMVLALALIWFIPNSTLAVVTHVPAYTVHGDNNGDLFGLSSNGAGDVNGDGTPDFIVGAPADNDYGSKSGSARVFSGIDGSVLYTFYGDSAGDYFGISVDGAGDVNRDGFADIIVGAYLDNSNGSNSGSVRVLSGADGAVLYNLAGNSQDDSFGRSVSGLGDINNDGFDDFIVGAPHDNVIGSAFVYSGATGTVLYSLHGTLSSEDFGESVNSAGDVNNDGIPDFIVGDRGDDFNGANSGSAKVYSGVDGSILFNFYGNGTDDNFGFSTSGAGDVNGDGYGDVIIGARFDDNFGIPNSGSARVLSGFDGSVLYEFSGENPDDDLGYSVDGAGDVNEDGRADLIIGIKRINSVATNSGSVQVLSGLDGSVLYNFDGDGPLHELGTSVSGIGDINHDGIADFIAGSRAGGLNGGGYVRIYISVPEPSMAVLCSAGMVSIIRRRGM